MGYIGEKIMLIDKSFHHYIKQYNGYAIDTIRSIIIKNSREIFLLLIHYN